MVKKELENFLDTDKEFDTLEKMEKYGGNFVKVLAKLYHAADRFNRVKLLETFGEYFTKYINFQN